MKVKFWIEQIYDDSYFVYGSSFYIKKLGDINLNKPYSKKEKELKKLTDNLKHKKSYLIKKLNFICSNFNVKCNIEVV